MDTTKRDRQLVIIVEDDEPAREACALYLEHRGYRVTAVPDAESALSSASQRAPGIAICDWHLGGGANGVDVARELQQIYRIPVIFMTAYPLDEIREAAVGIDVHAFLKKPLSLAALAKAVESATLQGP